MTNYFELIKIFCTVTNADSFKHAAIQLGKSPQVVTRAIKELEELKGETLFYRNTRNHKITKEGEELFRQAQPLLTQIHTLFDKSIDDPNQDISGEIRLTMPITFGKHIILPILIEFMKIYPKIKISCLMTDDHIDVIEKQIDIGLRVGFLNDNRFVSRKIRNINFVLVAAPSLISQIGEPKNINELDLFPTAVFDNLYLNQSWEWGFENDQSFLPSSPCFSTNDLDTYSLALIDGIGIGHLPDFMAIPLIENGQLVHVMQDIKLSSWGLYLYRPQLGPTSQKIRLLYDYLSNHFSNERIVKPADT